MSSEKRQGINLLDSHQAPGMLTVGTTLGAYEITGSLGAGGMGEVYRARDTKLGRDVAIKILPPHFTSDPDRTMRFEREARLLATLNHQHIGAIYGVEDAHGARALILELVEGQTLAERIAGPQLRARDAGKVEAIPVREALTIARQIAEALEAAHDKGIVHRDLKPGNIKITADGVVKVLDFGIAKAATADQASLDLSQSPTATAGTIEGTVLGTPAYMSPEQARGQVVDKRADIWSFGCVLYEMLAGRTPFRGQTVSDTIARILEREPDWSALPAAVPSNVVRMLRRCLDKDLKRRLHDIADARIEIDDAVEAPEGVPADTRPPAAGAGWQRLAIAAIVASLAMSAVAAVIYFRRAPDVTAATRLSVWTPGQISPQLAPVISPDGSELAFVSTSPSGQSMLWVRPLDVLEARVLPGTENAAHPFWSPDGRFLGFQAEGKLKTVAASGGPVETLADATLRIGGSWGKDGMILFVPRAGELGVVPAAGGAISTVLRGDSSDLMFGWPHFLPDGRHFLHYLRSAKPERSGVYLGSLDSKEIRLLLQTQFRAAYASGYLLFVRGETLWAQPFDTNRFELTGEPRNVADGLWVAPAASQASFSLSQTGALSYVNATLQDSQLAWVDRTGKLLGRIAEPGRYPGSPQLSPDGKRLAIAQGPNESLHIWLVDTADGTPSRITFGALDDARPVWSADGSRIAFQSRQPVEGLKVYVKRASGAGADELLFESSRHLTLEDWSHDGRFLVYSAAGEKSLSDLWLLPLGGDRQPAPFLQTAFNKTQAQVSPNGRWIAYTSYESGGDQVYVQSFPTPGSKRQISTAGGVQPRWRRDGKELFYLATDQQLMAVPVTGETTFEAGAPIPLFRTRTVPQGSQSIGLPTRYDVSPDGQRFMFMVPPEDSGPPITVVQNWMAALKK